MASTKQEEAILLEAARQTFLTENDRKDPAAVSAFNANVPLEKKAEEALGAAKEKLAPMKRVEEGVVGPTLVQNLVNAAPVPFNIPTIVVQGSEQESPTEAKAPPTSGKSGQGVVPDTPATPANPSKPPKYVIPDWYTVGWQKALALKNPPVPEGEAKDKQVLDTFVAQQFYASWFDDGGLMIFAILSSYFMTLLGFGWGWLVVILGICYTWHTTTVQRFERNVRDDITREILHTNLDNKDEKYTETVEWLNGFLQRFWYIYEPVLNLTISATVGRILSVSAPAFLHSIKLEHFQLGSKAPRVEKIATIRHEEGDIVQMEWDISFTPTDVMEMTQAQVLAKTNPKIALLIKLGKGIATASIPILVEDISVTGRMRLKLKLADTFPYVHIVDFCFMEKPEINYVLKPLAGGLDIANVPGLSSYIRDTTHWILEPMMYHPNEYRLNLEQIMSGRPWETAVGVVEVLVHSARNISGGSLTDGDPDPYIALAIDQQPEIAKTKWRPNTHNPTWMETKYVLVNKLEGNLNFHLYDHNERGSHTKLATASFDLSLLNADSVHEGVNSKLLLGDKERGELRYDINYYPVATPDVVPEGEINTEESTVGIVRLVIHQAMDLDTATSSSSTVNPYVKVYRSSLGPKKAAFTTNTYKETTKPIWEVPYEFLCTSKDEILHLKVVNDRDFRANPTIGYVSVCVKDLLFCKTINKDTFNLNGCQRGRLRISATWRSVAMSGSLHGAGQYTPPIGAVKLWIQKGVDLKNVDFGLGGKSDPYVRVQIRNETKGKTKVIDNDLNPVWDEIMYIPVHSLRESVMLDCMDDQPMSKDRPLGSTELRVEQLAEKSTTGDSRILFQSTGTKTFASTLKMPDTGEEKGVIHYQATFVPGWNMDVRFQQTGGSKDESDNESENGGYVTDGSTRSTASTASDKFSKLTFRPVKKPKLGLNTDVAGDVQDLAGTPVEMLDSGLATPGDQQAFPQENPVTRPQYAVEELLEQRSGIIVFNVVSGRLSTKGRIEVVIDDLEWPAVSTAKSRSKTAKWEHVGEGFIKEMDFSQVHLFLDAANEEGEDKVVSEWTGPVKMFLRDTMNGPQEFTLADKNGKNQSTVMIEARYIPVPIVLEERESVTNQGVLRVTLLDGHDILAVDKGATRSDPYVVFILNGEKVHKSEVQKKTISPVWNEEFSVPITSRVSSDFQVEVMDWNLIEQDEPLGAGSIHLKDLDPLRASDHFITLSTAKHGEKGRIRVRLLFEPQIIAKARKATSTFSVIGNRAMTQVGSLPANAGKGIKSGVSSVFKR